MNLININLPFLKKSKVGINISSDSISIAELERNGREYQIKEFKSSDIKGLLKPSLTEPNIINTETFKKTMAELIGRKKTYASISIPIISVKTTLLEFESLPQKKGEIERLIKWKIEKSIPFPLEDTRLSYQVLNKREEGKSNILTSIIKKAVLFQYEEILKGCGIEPVLIDSSSFHIFNLYHDFIMRDSSNQNFIFLDLRGDIFAMMIFKKGAPDFIRIKPIKANSEIKRIKDELIASLKFYSHSADISDLRNLYYLGDLNIDETLMSHRLTRDDEINPPIPPLIKGGEGGLKLLFDDMDMQIKRLGVNQMPWLEKGLRNTKAGELTGLLPAIGAAMER